MIDFSKSVISLTKECKEQHERMKAKGFHDRDVSLAETFGLIISEMCEAMEAERKGRLASNQMYDFVMIRQTEDEFISAFKESIKDSVSDELADVFIRCMYAVGKYNKEGNDVVLFNHCIKERVNQMKHSPNTFAYYVYILSSWSTINEKTCCQNLMVMMEICAAIAIIHNIDLDKAIDVKIRYNKTRGYKHGKKY